MKEIRVKVIQDMDSDWYWIPESLLKRFNDENDFLESKEYMECPEKFDAFTDKYSSYATGGCPSIQPDFFKENNLTPIKL